MLGNLSKVLIKTPSFFENKDQDNTKNQLYRIAEENEANIFNSIKIKSKRGNSINSIYFREKDFWKKNFENELNFNHNKKLLFKLKISPLKSENNSVNLNKIKNSNNIINNKKRKDSYISMNSPKSTNGRTKNNDSIYENNLMKSANHLKTDPNKIFADNNKILNDININNNISNNINKSDDEEKEEQVNNNNNNKNNYKFPKIKNTFRSPESLFQEKADKKFTSLISVKPQIKEQLKEKNRCIVGYREFLMFQKSRNMNAYNPFYESMKMKEEMNNSIFKKNHI